VPVLAGALLIACAGSHYRTSTYQVVIKTIKEDLIMSRQENLYKKLRYIGVLEAISKGRNKAVSIVEEPGLVPLHMTVLYRDDQCILISLTQFYERHSKICADPEMTVRLDPEQEEAYALTYHQTDPSIYQKVGLLNPNMRLRRVLTIYLNKWITKVIDQGHSFKCIS
jgi:hypothetical protein